MTEGLEKAVVRDERGRFEPGQSGNPAGKTPGTRNRATLLRAALDSDEGPAMARIVIDKALAGDVVAARFCLDRLEPKPRSRPIEIDLPDGARARDLVAAFDATVRAMAAGEITPDEAGLGARAGGAKEAGRSARPDQAALASPRILAMNSATLFSSVVACTASSAEAPRTRSAPMPASAAVEEASATEDDTSIVLPAATVALRAISCVAESCCVIALATEALTRSMPETACSASSIAAEERATSSRMAVTCAAISAVARIVLPARFLTSLATTAKPLPASPARAASIVALSARRLVWLAMSLISLTTSPMLAASLNRPWTVVLVRSASATAFCAIAADCAT